MPNKEPEKCITESCTRKAHARIAEELKIKEVVVENIINKLLL